MHVSLIWWMRVVGALYIVFGLGAITRQPIKAEGPPDAMDRVKSGEPLARFMADTWITLGLLLCVIGIELLIWSSSPSNGRALAWTVVTMELAWGIPIDGYKLARGYRKGPPVTWILIHAVIALTGILALR